MTAEIEIIDVEQGSDEWFVARLGKATGSRAADVLAGTGTLGSKKMSKEPTTRCNYRFDLALERISHKVQPGWQGNEHSNRGHEREAEALASYEVFSANMVRRTGFVQSLSCEAGCSLDGDVGNFTGIVEVKCPIPAVHWETVRTRTVPQRYLGQLTHAMWITGARWADFVSFCPEFESNLRLVVVHCERSDGLIRVYTWEVERFLAEVNSLEAKLILANVDAGALRFASLRAAQVVPA